MTEPLTLPAEAEAALAKILEASRTRPVLVFKKSPICPVSTMAETEYQTFLADTEVDLQTVEIDVIGARPLARGLTAALDVQHESPQALLFVDGALRWHDSHGALTSARFAEVLAGKV